MRFTVTLKRFLACDRVDRCQDMTEAIAAQQGGAIENRLEDRDRIGEAGGLDDDTIEIRYRTGGALVVETFKGSGEIAIERAAEASLSQEDDLPLNRLDKRMIETHFAELVDDHGRVHETRIPE